MFAVRTSKFPLHSYGHCLVICWNPSNTREHGIKQLYPGLVVYLKLFSMRCKRSLDFTKKKEIKTTFWRNLIRVMVEVLTEVEFKVSAASLLNQLFEGPKQLNSWCFARWSWAAGVQHLDRRCSTGPIQVEASKYWGAHDMLLQVGSLPQLVDW